MISFLSQNCTANVPPFPILCVQGDMSVGNNLHYPQILFTWSRILIFQVPTSDREAPQRQSLFRAQTLTTRHFWTKSVLSLTLSHTQSSIDSNSQVTQLWWIGLILVDYRIIGPITKPQVGAHWGCSLCYVAHEDDCWEAPTNSLQVSQIYDELHLQGRRLLSTTHSFQLSLHGNKENQGNSL